MSPPRHPTELHLPTRTPPSARRRSPCHPDPSVQVVHDALAFVTAAIDGAGPQAMEIADDALRTDREGFVDALATTVVMLVEEADEAGLDLRDCLRDIAMGIAIIEP